MSWTDERIEKLTKMWEGGATASQIAEELGGVSRNAVIGKAHRLGLKARPSPVKPNDKSEAAPAKVPRPAAEPPAPAEPREAAPRPVPAPPAPPAPRASVAAAPVASPAAPSEGATVDTPAPAPQPRIVSVGPGGFLRQGPGDQQAPIPPAPPRRSSRCTRVRLKRPCVRSATARPPPRRSRSPPRLILRRFWSKRSRPAGCS